VHVTFRAVIVQLCFVECARYDATCLGTCEDGESENGANRTSALLRPNWHLVCTPPATTSSNTSSNSTINVRSREDYWRPPLLLRRRRFAVNKETKACAPVEGGLQTQMSIGCTRFELGPTIVSKRILASLPQGMPDAGAVTNASWKLMRRIDPGGSSHPQRLRYLGVGQVLLGRDSVP
jgi:hypothetical protein